MAVGLGLPERQFDATNEEVKRLIAEQGLDINIMKGTVGEYYKDKRGEDITNLCKEILMERELEIECSQCKGEVWYQPEYCDKKIKCMNCEGGLVMTEFGEKVLDFVRRRLLK